MIRNKKIITILISIFLIAVISTTAFASDVAWKDFSVTLPMASANVYGGMIAKSTEDRNYFTITVSSISNGFTAVRAWTEKPLGSNYSNPYYQVGVTENKNITYDKAKPKAGDNIKLNLDNPVKTTTKPTVKGKWTPN